MPRRHDPVIALASAALGLLAACGGPDPSGLELALSTSALSADLSRAHVDVFPDATCEDIRATGPRARGSYRLDLDLTPSAGAAEGELSAIRPGRYVLAVWGLASDGTARAFGCTPILIETGRRTLATVTLATYP